MNTIKELVRKNIQQLIPYSSAREECYMENGILLDANEHPYGPYNRYPDPQQRKLKEAIARYKNIAPEQIFLGNGSDEAIDIAVRVFCEPGRDKILYCPPTFGVISVVAAINHIIPVIVPTTTNFQLNMELLPALLKEEHLKMFYLCTPNNPTANLLHEKDVLYVLEHFKGIVLIDEAYMEFSRSKSYTRLLQQYPRLVVLQTFSKAWGMAGIRVGMAIAAPEIVHYFNNVKMPYNISEANQEIALQRLQEPGAFEAGRKAILREKEILKQGLAGCAVVKKIYPSDANFFLVEVTDAAAVYQQLIAQNIIVRNQHKAVNNCLRITTGTPEENRALVAALKTIQL